MARTTPRNGGSSPAVLTTLGWLRREKFKPVPLRPGSKAAVDGAYAKDDYNPPSDEHWQQHNLGIGVVTGPRAGGPVDVDLDCTEALRAAPLLLPRTAAIFGRKSKPASHYLYRVDSEEFLKRAFIDPIDKSTIVELRADGGHQTVMPGSLHQDTAEPVEWSTVPFPEVIKIPADELSKCVSRLAMAVLIARHMWADGQRNEICKHVCGMLYYLEWKQSEAVEFIRAVMTITGDDDKTRLLTLNSTYKKGEAGGKITGAATLRKFLGDDLLVDRLLEWSGSSASLLVQSYNERWATVTVGSKWRVADTRLTGSPPVFYTQEDFLRKHAYDKEMVEGKPVSRAKIWINHPRHRSYESVDFLPGQEDTGEILNLWPGWATTPQAGDCSAWFELLREVICGGNDELINWLLHWFANILREPVEKSKTAPVIIGRQGAGKSLLLSYFGRILGSAYIVATNAEHVHGRFNNHMATALLLHSEEALYGGDKSHRGIIKSMITDEFRLFEPKGVDARQVKNYLRLILTSNDPHAAPVEARDRRFTVIDMNDRTISPDLIKRVLYEMNNGGPAALHYHLLDSDYDPAIPRANYKTEAAARVHNAYMQPIESWWHDALANGQIMRDDSTWCQRPETEDWPEVVSSSALYVCMKLFLQGRRNQIPEPVTFGDQLNKLVGHTLIRAQRSFSNPKIDGTPQELYNLSNRQNTILNMPPLELCRAAFEDHIGRKIEWPAPDDNPPPKIKDDF